MEPTGDPEVGTTPPGPTCRSGRAPPTLAGVSTHADDLSAPLAAPAEVAVPVPAPSDAELDARRSSADRFMRRLLRIEGRPEPAAIFGAQKAMTGSILVSAVRCTITYLLVPILAPVVGVLDLLAAPVSLTLCVVAVAMSTRSMRRFWKADHAKRWHYTALVVVVWGFLAVAAVRDVGQLIG